MFRTREHGNRAMLDPEHRMPRVVWCEPAAWTVDPACGSMLQELRRLLRRQATDGAELFDVVLTPDQTDRQLIQ
jgi:hypothetical protein